MQNPFPVSGMPWGITASLSVATTAVCCCKLDACWIGDRTAKNQKGKGRHKCVGRELYRCLEIFVLKLMIFYLFVIKGNKSRVMMHMIHELEQFNCNSIY